MGDSNIGWTQKVENALRGCTRKSDGCRNCYAEWMAWRHVLMCRALGRACPYDGLVEMTSTGPRWTGVIRFDERQVLAPLRWKKPARVFVNSMSDLFHEKVATEWIDRHFAVFALARQHTFQCLTKRADRMLAYFSDVGVEERIGRAAESLAGKLLGAKEEYTDGWRDKFWRWPLPNVHLGVSVENQKEFETRAERLGQTPAALRFISFEPLLGDIECGNVFDDPPPGSRYGRIGWAIVGVESRGSSVGRNADGYGVHARAIIRAARLAGVPVFHKQMPVGGRVSHDPTEWPEWARVQDYPTVAA